MPVRRVSNGSRASVFAFRDELHRCLANANFLPTTRTPGSCPRSNQFLSVAPLFFGLPASNLPLQKVVTVTGGVFQPSTVQNCYIPARVGD